MKANGITRTRAHHALDDAKALLKLIAGDGTSNGAYLLELIGGPPIWPAIPNERRQIVIEAIPRQKRRVNEGPVNKCSSRFTWVLFFILLYILINLWRS